MPAYHSKSGTIAFPLDTTNRGEFDNLTIAHPISTHTIYEFPNERSARKFANGRTLMDRWGNFHYIQRGAVRKREGCRVHVLGQLTATWLTA